MNAYEALTPITNHIRQELAQVAAREGFPPAELTGSVLVDDEHGAVWFETIDQFKTLGWVTRDMEERADWGETLVYAESREEALSYDESN